MVMNKNIIILTCDGLSYDMVCSNENHKAPMKFVESLRNKSIWCTNVYSQGPYTEAGVMGLLHGKYPLSNGGYFVDHLAWEDSIFKVLNDNQYDLFASYFASFLPIELTQKGKYSYVTLNSNPCFSRYLHSKLDYYYEIYKKSDLSEVDYKLITRLLYRHFESINTLYSSESINNEVTGNMTPYKIYDEDYCLRVKEGLAKIREELEKFKRDEKEYIVNLFENYSQHYLMSGCNWAAPPYTDEMNKQKKWIKKNYEILYKKIRKLNKRYYLKNNMPPFSYMWKHILQVFNSKTRRQGSEFFYRLYQTITQFDTSKMNDVNLQQICTSAGTYVDQFIQWRDNRSESTPYFAYLHFDEYHKPLSFITHESLDYERLKEEFIDVEEYLNSLEENYKGNIGFDLAALYLDKCIEKLFHELQKRGELDNTIIVITADHASSNCGGMARFTATNNFYREQYHVPLCIYGCGKEEFESFVNQVDIPATLLDVIGIKQPKDWIGHSILKNSRTFTTVEYCGSGVPDMSRREVFFMFNDNKKSFVVSSKLMLNPTVNDLELLEYYDLLKDPLQLHNLKDAISSKEKKECKEFFFKRVSEQYLDYEKYLKSI